MQQIQQELTAIRVEISDLAEKIEAAYQGYLQLLSEISKKQLLLSCYYLCTQIYPEPFLKLNLDRRGSFQQKLRQISQVVQFLLYQNILEIIKLSSLPHSSQMPTPQSVSTGETNAESTSDNQETKAAVDSINSNPNSNQDNPDLVKVINQNNLIKNHISIEKLISNNSIELLETLQKKLQDQFQSIDTPEELLKRHKQIEKGISRSLDNLCLEVNKLLQQSGILTQKIPPQLLELPMHSEEAGTAIEGLPHLLELSIEIGNNRESENTIFAKVVLTRLKVSELEFIDFNLGKERNQIRNLIAEVNKLRYQYQKLKKEYLIAQAEHAWRSSWYEG
jgi:hypothetical protein